MNQDERRKNNVGEGNLAAKIKVRKMIRKRWKHICIYLSIFGGLFMFYGIKWWEFDTTQHSLWGNWGLIKIKISCFYWYEMYARLTNPMVMVQHRGHAIKPEAIKAVLFHPPAQVRQQEPQHFPATHTVRTSGSCQLHHRHLHISSWLINTLEADSLWYAVVSSWTDTGNFISATTPIPAHIPRLHVTQCMGS